MGTLIEAFTWNGGAAIVHVPPVPSVFPLAAPAIPESASLTSHWHCGEPNTRQLQRVQAHGWNIRYQVEGLWDGVWICGAVYLLKVLQGCRRWLLGNHTGICTHKDIVLSLIVPCYLLCFLSLVFKATFSPGIIQATDTGSGYKLGLESEAYPKGLCARGLATNCNAKQ